jgi:predicted DNA-binding transcriptional regulator YafY
VKIANFNGRWYLLALDAEADRIISFRLNAIKKLKEMEEDPISESQKDHWHKTLKDGFSFCADEAL